MEFQKGNPRAEKPAESREESENISAKHASETAAYLSPISSAIPSLHSLPASPQASEQSDDWRITGEGIKNAKKYWQLVYTNQKHRRPGANKRKDYDSTDDHDRAKRRQCSSSSSPSRSQSRNSTRSTTFHYCGGFKPATVGVEHDIQAPATILARLDRVEQMQLVKANVDPNNLQALRDLQKLHEAVVSLGHGKCKFVNDKWKLHGFGTSLYHHQVIGVSWMLSRELHPMVPNGGILADEMGLGKTVQILACMSQNMPGKNAKASKTLIIVPKRLISQWAHGIEKHCSNGKMKNLLVYGAGQRILNPQWEAATIMHV